MGIAADVTRAVASTASVVSRVQIKVDTHVGHVRFVYICVTPVVLTPNRCEIPFVKFVTCAYRPPNRYETSLPYTRQCAV